jgi:hypothetical protein
VTRLTSNQSVANARVDVSDAAQGLGQDGRLAILVSLGIGSQGHTNGTLISHLLGTSALLEAWQQRPSVINAGLIHSVYGTESYKAQPISLNDRKKVEAIVGSEAEGLAYFFGVMERDSLYQNFHNESYGLRLRDRITERFICIARQDLVDLSHIVLANWLEQRPRVDKRYQLIRRREFFAMRAYLSSKARESLDSAYGFLAS